LIIYLSINAGGEINSAMIEHTVVSSCILNQNNIIEPFSRYIGGKGMESSIEQFNQLKMLHGR